MKSRCRIAAIILGVYFLVTLPLVIVFLKSEYVRYIAMQMVTHWKGKIGGLDAIFIGDSITAGGRNWSAFPDALNLGVTNYTVWQIEESLYGVEQYQARNIFIMAGTNDIVGRRGFDAVLFREDYERLINQAQKLEARVVVTLIPYSSKPELNEAISKANRIILELVESRNIPTVDLNPILAPQGLLLPDYTTDGIHLSGPAYSIWRKELDQIRAEYGKMPVAAD